MSLHSPAIPHPVPIHRRQVAVAAVVLLLVLGVLVRDRMRATAAGRRRDGRPS